MTEGTIMVESGTRQDAKISGDGYLPGGAYGDVVINGAGHMRGDIDATTLKVNGSGDADGSVTAQTTSVNGAATFDGDLHSGETVVKGAATVRGSLDGGRLTVMGTTDIRGSVKAEAVDVRGELKVGGDVEAESFKTLGRFVIGGLLNAGTVDISLYVYSEAREIGGERIDVRAGTQGPWSWLASLGTSEKRLVADTIEGDSVYLEYTTAKVVRGGKVDIGPGCRIDLVEYTTDLRIAEVSAVKSSRQVEAAVS